MKKNKEQVWGKKFMKQQNHVEPRKNFPTYKNMLVNSGQLRSSYIVMNTDNCIT